MEDIGNYGYTLFRTIPPLPSFPTIVSISQSATVCPLAYAGLSSMETRLGIGVLVLEAELLTFLPPYLRCRWMLSLWYGEMAAIQL